MKTKGKKEKKMKKLYYERYYFKKGTLFDEVQEVLKSNHVDADEVELFGCTGFSDKPYEYRHLPEYSYQLVNNGSRETILIYEDGKFITNPDEIEKWENKNCSDE